MSRWLAERISARPGRALGLIVLLCVAMAVAAAGVRLDNNFSQLFSTDSPDSRFRAEHRERWGADDGLLVAVLSVDDRADRTELASASMAVTDAVADMAELTRVNSLTTVPVVRTAKGAPATLAPVWADGTPAASDVDATVAAATASELGTADLISADGRVTLVVGELDARYDSYEEVVGPADEFERRVRDAVAEATEGDHVGVGMAGVAFTRIAAISEMQGDLIKLFPLATLAVAVILWLWFRRLVAVAAPMLAIGASMIGTAGVIGLAGDDLNQITIVIPVLLMGVVVATATHVVHRFYLERAAGATPQDAARTTIERVARTALVCTVTNAIGFASLAAAELRILHEFGLYLAAGVGFCLVATTVVIPAVMQLRAAEPPERYLAGGTGFHPPDVPTDRAARYAAWMQRPGRAAAVVGFGLVLVAASGWYATTARYDYSLSGSLDAGRPVAQANATIDRRLSGIVPIEISLAGPPGAFERAETIDRLDRFDRWLRSDADLRPIGLAALVRAGTELGLGEPDTDQLIATLFDTVRADPSFGPVLRTMVTDDASHARLRAQHPDTGARDVVALADRIDAEGTRVFAGTGISVRTTGEAPVAYRGMNELTRELVNATLIAVVLIIAAIAVAFRSLSLGLVALLPNVAPLAAGLALYTAARDTLDPVPGVVFCIAMGLAADDTIHLMNRIRELRPHYPTMHDAIVAAFSTVRRAMVSSTAVLVAAFAALGMSGFPTNRTLGVLGAAVLLMALGSDLLFGLAGLSLLGRRREGQGRNIDRALLTTASSTMRPSSSTTTPTPEATAAS